MMNLEDYCYYYLEKIVVVDQMDCRYHEPLQFLEIFPYYDDYPSRIVLVMSLCRMMMDCALGWYIGRISQKR